MLHDVRQRGVLGTGATHSGAEDPRRVGTAYGHWRGRHNPVTDWRAGHRGRQGRVEVSEEIRHNYR